MPCNIINSDNLGGSTSVFEQSKEMNHGVPFSDAKGVKGLQNKTGEAVCVIAKTIPVNILAKMARYLHQKIKMNLSKNK